MAKYFRKNATICVSGAESEAVADMVEPAPNENEISPSRIDGSINPVLRDVTSKIPKENDTVPAFEKSTESVNMGGGGDNTIVAITIKQRERTDPTDKHAGKRSDGRHETCETAGEGGTVCAHKVPDN